MRPGRCRSAAAPGVLGDVPLVSGSRLALLSGPAYLASSRRCGAARGRAGAAVPPVNGSPGLRAEDFGKLPVNSCACVSQLELDNATVATLALRRLFKSD